MRALSRRIVLGSTVGDLIGGRWAISWIAYVLNAPVNLVAVGSNAGSSGLDAPWAAWLLASTLGYLGFGAVFLAAHLTLFRHRAARPVSAGRVAWLGGIAGGIRGLIVAMLAASWGLVPSDLLLLVERVAIGIVLGALLVPLVAFMLGSIDAYRSQRRALLAQSRRLRAIALQEAGVSRELEAALVTSVQAELDEVVRTGDPAVARAVSHRIWGDGHRVAPEPRMHWQDVLQASIQRNPFATLPVAGIWAIAAFGTLTTAIGLPRALAQIAFSILAISIMFAFGRRLVARQPQHALAIVVGTLVALVVVTGPIASALFDPRPWPTGASLVIANALWLPLLTLTVGFVTAAVRSGEAVLTDLCDMVSEDELAAIVAHDEQERLRAELAGRLHGSIQSKLLVAAARPLDDAARAEWVSALREPPITRASGADLADRLMTLAEPWQALVDIDLDLAGDVPPAAHDRIIRIVEEAITNAYRHGSASSVRIRVVAQRAHTLVEVVDNGRGIRPGTTPGLGSAILDVLAPDAWVRERDGDETMLRALVSHTPLH